ncbi:hypothetical protein MNBD_DELTA03-1218, partial [hydrothermal vent metagenome]
YNGLRALLRYVARYSLKAIHAMGEIQ